MAKKKIKRSFSQRDVELAGKVKRANQRLRELEKQKLTNSPAYKAAERLALRKPWMMSTTKKTTKSGRNAPKNTGALKFTTNIRSLSAAQRRALEEQVDMFLNAKTSTTKGSKAAAKSAKEAYKKAAKEHTGIDLSVNTLNEWLEIWNTAIVQQYYRMYGSDFTEYIVNQLMGSQLNYNEAVQFLTDHYGEPITRIMESLSHDNMERGGDPWEWEDIYSDNDFE